MNIIKVNRGKTTRYYNLDAIVWFEYEPDAPTRARGAFDAIAKAGKPSSSETQPIIRLGFSGSKAETIAGPDATRVFHRLTKESQASCH